jgi:hypothetical protein
MTLLQDLRYAARTAVRDKPFTLVRAGYRDRLERLCRCALRPALAREQLHTTSDGGISLSGGIAERM